MATEPWAPQQDGLKLFVKLAPKAGKERLLGLEGTPAGRLRLKVAVTAPPEKGKANAALIALLAKRLGLAKSRLRIASGATNREKTIMIEGDAAELTARLREAFLNSLTKAGKDR